MPVTSAYRVSYIHTPAEKETSEGDREVSGQWRLAVTTVRTERSHLNWADTQESPLSRRAIRYTDTRLGPSNRKCEMTTLVLVSIWGSAVAGGASDRRCDRRSWSLDAVWASGALLPLHVAQELVEKSTAEHASLHERTGTRQGCPGYDQTRRTCLR